MLTVIGYLLGGLGAVLLLCVILGLLVTVVVPWLFQLLLAFTLLGAIGLVFYKAIQGYRRASLRAKREDEIIEKLEAAPRLDVDGLKEFLGDKGETLRQSAPDLLEKDGKPAWEKVGSFLSGLGSLSELLTSPGAPDVRRTLYQKTEPLLGRLVADVDVLKGAVAQDLHLRQREQVTAEAEKARLMAEAEKAKEETVRLELDKEQARARALELERTKKLGTFTVEEHVERLMASLQGGEVPEEQQPPLWQAYLRLKDLVAGFSDETVEDRGRIGPDELRLLQVRTLLNRHYQEQERVRQGSLPDEEKRARLGFLERLRARDLTELDRQLQGGGEETC